MKRILHHPTKYDHLPHPATFNMIPSSSESSPIAIAFKQPTLPSIVCFDQGNSQSHSNSQLSHYQPPRNVQLKPTSLQQSVILKLSQVSIESQRYDKVRPTSNKQQSLSPLMGVQGASLQKIKIENNKQLHFKQMPSREHIFLKPVPSVKYKAQPSIRMKYGIPSYTSKLLAKTIHKPQNEQLYSENENSPNLKVDMVSIKYIQSNSYVENVNLDSLLKKNVQVERAIMKMNLRKIKKQLKKARDEVNSLKTDVSRLNLQDYTQSINNMIKDQNQIDQDIKLTMQLQIGDLKGKVSLLQNKTEMLNILNQELISQEDKNYIQVCQLLENQ